ncbi:MAG TPA: hypothetical protein VF062_24720 [Candidatus Limnocylindrales bacterium]
MSESERRADRVDLLLTVVIALAAVATTWAGFQSTKWSGVQANSYAQAGAARTESSRMTTEASELRIIDVSAFVGWLDALDSELRADPAGGLPEAYRPQPGTISGFMFTRFRDEFRPAVDAWLATRPLVNPDAPPTPFAMPEYRLAADEEAARLAQRSEEYAAQARDANQRADNYVLTAVVFALVLFFAAMGQRATRKIPRRLLIALTLVAFAVAVVTLATYPVEL